MISVDEAVVLARNVVIYLMVDVVVAVTSRVVRFGYLGIRCCFSVILEFANRCAGRLIPSLPHLAGLVFSLH